MANWQRSLMVQCPNSWNINHPYRPVICVEFSFSANGSVPRVKPQALSGQNITSEKVASNGFMTKSVKNEKISHVERRVMEQLPDWRSRTNRLRVRHGFNVHMPEVSCITFLPERSGGAAAARFCGLPLPPQVSGDDVNGRTRILRMAPLPPFQ